MRKPSRQSYETPPAELLGGVIRSLPAVTQGVDENARDARAQELVVALVLRKALRTADRLVWRDMLGRAMEVLCCCVRGRDRGDRL